MPPMSLAQRRLMPEDKPLRLIGARLAQLLDAPERAAVLQELEATADGLDAKALGSLVDRLVVRDMRREAELAQRTFQLGLVLDILRTRDEVAAEQAEWDFATDLQLSG